MIGLPMKWQAKNQRSGLDVEFGADEALVEGAAGFADLGDAVEHQHGRRGQLRIARAEQLAAGAGQQILIAVAGLLFLPSSLFPVAAGAGLAPSSYRPSYHSLFQPETDC